MKLCKVAELNGGEILAKAVITSDYKVLLSDGSVIRPEYIQKIRKIAPILSKNLIKSSVLNNP